jgi:hypothetical protein
MDQSHIDEIIEQDRLFIREIEGLIWQPIGEVIKESQARATFPILLYSEEFIDLDANPQGIIEGYFQEEGRLQDGSLTGKWFGAVFDIHNDEWAKTEVKPTHYRSMGPQPGSPFFERYQEFMRFAVQGMRDASTQHRRVLERIRDQHPLG